MQELAAVIDASEAYSYQYNLKIVGLPSDTERESTEMTTNLCLKLFAAMGVRDVSINGGYLHRPPSSIRWKATVNRWNRNRSESPETGYLQIYTPPGTGEGIGQ